MKAEQRQRSTTSDDVAEPQDATHGLSVIVPTYNERANITLLVERAMVALAEYDFELVVVDDDSPDGTADAVRTAYGDDDRVRVIQRTDDPGLAQAVTRGFREASFEYFAVIDADLQHPPEKLPELFDALADGADVAIGSRHVDGGGIENWSTYRKLVSRGATLMARLGLRDATETSDPMSGFFAVRRNVIEDVELDPRGYKILLEVLAKGDYDTVTEVPYVFRERERGESNLTPKEYLNFLSHIVTLIAYQLGEGSTQTPQYDDVAVVSAYPPDDDGLAEYARKLVRGYDDVSDSSLVIASGEEQGDDSGESTTVQRVWEKGSPRGLISIVSTLWQERIEYDYIHFNIKPTYFGGNNLLRFTSLFVPLVTRVLVRKPIIVTMHDIIEGVDEDSIEEDIGIIELAGATFATQAILLSGSVTVTNERYEELLDEKYPFGDVHTVPHGIVEYDGDHSVPREPFRMLLFGFISPYKDYETVFEAFEQLRENHDVELVVAGTAHPDHPELSDRIHQSYSDWEDVSFTGFVTEEEIPALFNDSSLLVLPYKTAPGVSGPYQEAKSYGLPVVVYDNEDVLDATTGTGGTAEPVPPGDSDELARAVSELIEYPRKAEQLAETNLEAEQTTMTDVANQMKAIVNGDTDE